MKGNQQQIQSKAEKRQQDIEMLEAEIDFLVWKIKETNIMSNEIESLYQQLNQKQVKLNSVYQTYKHTDCKLIETKIVQ